MAWNQPGNNGQDNDPWGNKKKSGSQSSSDIFKKMNDLFKKGSNGSNGSQRPSKEMVSIRPKWIILLILIVIAAIWVVNGFHTINQSERGVVTRLGKVENELAMPGLNWFPPLIDKVYRVDTQGTRSINVKGYMITAGENLVYVEMNVQYRISDPKKYLFNVTNVSDSLVQAADSALRSEVGSTNMDSILSDGRAVIESRTKELLEQTIDHYDMGIRIVDLNFQTANPPSEVQAAYDDAIKAREDKVSEINKAEADSVQYKQESEGKAARIIAEANAYKIAQELEAQGDVARFEKLWPEYQKAPALTKERLYIEMMEKVLSSTNKVIMDENNNALMMLPLGAAFSGKAPADFKTERTAPETDRSSSTLLNNKQVEQGTFMNSAKTMSQTSSQTLSQNLRNGR